jgi:hypothetical protein
MPNSAGCDFARGWRVRKKSPLSTERALPGVPHHSELEPSRGVPHRLGGASENGGVSFLPAIRAKLSTRAGASA